MIAPSRPSRLWLVALLLVAYWAMAVSISPRIGVTADEPVHLAGGYSYWRLNDYRMQPENGTLAMRVAALPLLGMHLAWVPADDPEWQRSSANNVGHTFLFQLGNPRDRILLAARAMIALFGVLTLWLIWRWATFLWGDNAGLLALTMAAFSPTLLAHGGLATSDMAITACLLAAVTSFWRLIHRITWGRFAVAVLASGAALLAKMSGVLIAPMFAALLIVRLLRPTPIVIRLGRRPISLGDRLPKAGALLGATAATTVGALVVLWGGYGFRYATFPPEHAEGARLFFDWPEILDERPLPDFLRGDARSVLARPPTAPSPTLVTKTIGFAREHHLLPEAYLWGFAHTYKFSRQRPAFLNGEFSMTGWPSFFPWTFWLKTPVPVLVLFTGGLAALGYAWGRGHKAWVYRAAPLLTLAVVYGLVALRMKLNIGHRHILPLYPVVFVGCGASAWWLIGRWQRWVGAALAMAVLSQAAASVAARPFYLSYFQPLAGGTDHGWRHLVDSSYDWGQGLPDFARWLQERRQSGDPTPVYLSYFGADSPRDRGIAAIRFGDEVSDMGERTYPVRPVGGWFAISATHFQRVYLRLAGPWTEHNEELYQALRGRLADETTARRLPRSELLGLAMDYEALEFGRLCHFLRHAEPLQVIGGSILLFRLSDAEVAYALGAPLADLNARTGP